MVLVIEVRVEGVIVFLFKYRFNNVFVICVLLMVYVIFLGILFFLDREICIM